MAGLAVCFSLLATALIIPGYAIWHPIGAFFDRGTISHADVMDLRSWTVALGNTGLVCGAALLTAVALGGSLAFLIVSTDMTGRHLLLAVSFLMASVPPSVGVVTILAVVPVRWLSGSGLFCGILHGLLYTPLATVLFALLWRAPSRERVPERDDMNLQRLWCTAVRGGWPGVLFVSASVALLVATECAAADILMVRTVAVDAYTRFILDRKQTAPLLTTFPLTLILAALLAGLMTWHSPFQSHATGQNAPSVPIVSLGRARRVAGTLASLVAGAVLAALAGSLLSHVAGAREFWSTVRSSRSELANSALLGVAGATTLFFAAWAITWGATRNRVARVLWFVVTVLLLALPAPTIGICITALFDRPGPMQRAYDSLLPAAVACCIRFLPIAILLLSPSGQQLLDHAQTLICGRAPQQKRTLRGPLPSRGGISALLTWWVLAVLCFGDAGATVLVAAPAWPLASVQTFALLHFGVYGDLAALVVAGAVSVVLPGLGVMWLLLARARTSPIR